MPSKREQVITAVVALISAALPGADVARNSEKRTRISPGGFVNVLDGDPGEPDIEFSPPSYTYQHSIPLEVIPSPDDPRGVWVALDEMLSAIGAALDADPTLGGLCQTQAVAPTTDDADQYGTQSLHAGFPAILAEYTTSNPLG